MEDNDRYIEEREISQQTQQMFREQQMSVSKGSDNDKQNLISFNSLIQNAENIKAERRNAREKSRYAARQKVTTHHYAAPAKNNDREYAESIHTGDSQEEHIAGDNDTSLDITVQDNVTAASVRAEAQTMVPGQPDSITLLHESEDERDTWATDREAQNTDKDGNGRDDRIDLEEKEEYEREYYRQQYEEEEKEREDYER